MSASSRSSAAICLPCSTGIPLRPRASPSLSSWPWCRSAWSAYLNDNQLVSHGFLEVRVSRMALTAVFATVAGAIAINLYGYNGAAAVTLASEAVLVLLYMDAVRRRVGSDFVLYPVGLKRASA